MEGIIPPNDGYFLTVKAYDADTPPLNNQVRYFLKDGDADLFYVNASTGDIALRTVLDREKQAEHILTIIAMDTGSPPLTGTGTINVVVQDFNDNAPMFDMRSYTAAVQENSEIGTSVIKIMALDADAGVNGLVTYTMSGSNVFKINSKTGEIETAAEIDREVQKTYKLTITAFDAAVIQPLNSTVELLVTIVDLNDNNPSFEREIYNVLIPDDLRENRFMIGVVAKDADSGRNGEIIYSITGRDANKFIIDPKSGIVTTGDGFKAKGTYQVNIHAQDQGEEPKSTACVLSIQTKPAHLFPVFSPLQKLKFTFPENVQKGKIFSKIDATSPKSGQAGRIRYSIASGNAVIVNETTGDLAISETGLDYELSSQYTVWIAATDSDTPALSTITSITIMVTDVNDNAPKMSQNLYVAEVLEGEYPPQVLMNVEATDADTNENSAVKYLLVDTFEDTFDIDTDTGEIITMARLDREEKAQYELVVRAVDGGKPRLSSSATVLVKVLDKNDNPPRFTRLFSVNVTENAEMGTFVIRVTSVDLDSDINANVTYSFSENPGELFKIDPLSGNVTVNGHLDREQQEEHILKVTAFDGAWRSETPLTITVQDQNDNAPEFEHSYYSFNFPEFQKKSAYVGQVIATDRDKSGPNSIISYALQKPSDIFMIDPATGVLSSKRTLHYKHTQYSPENIYSFTVIATDNGKPPMYTECLVNVNIIDANNNEPVFLKKQYITPVLFGAKYGQRVVQVEARDEHDFGINAEVSYTIVGGNGSNYFSINHNDGWISSSRPVNSEVGQIFELQVKAFDRGIPPQHDEATVIIVVSGENKYAPVFTALSYQVIVPENEPVGSSILTISATDKDSGLNAAVVYSISGGNDRGEFTINPNSGSVIITQPLDFEVTPEYHLNITATDMGFKPLKTVAMLKVTLTDINDCSPQFDKTEYHAYLVENAPSDSTVFHVKAFDRDSQKNAVIEYNIVSGQGRDFFKIEKTTGIIRSKISFDYEEENTYELNLTAKNPGSKMIGSTKVIVHITGVNEFVPKFIQPVFHFDVSESTEIGSTIGSIRAVDKDLGADGKIYYHLFGSSHVKGFNVNRDTGEIKISRPLDRESQSRVVLTVIAKNFGSIRGNDTDEAQVIIAIQDGNDPPEFERKEYETNLLEDVRVGTEVIQVLATDKDVKPQNQQFTYSIIGGNVNEAFRIDSEIGSITTAKLLDRENVMNYELILGAIDTGLPPQTGTATVKINIVDVNDNGPMFEQELLTGYILENEPPGTSIMTLTASDPDSAANGPPFTYRISGGTHQNLVSIDKQTGVLKTTKTIDREQFSELTIEVEVEDSGSPRMKSKHKVTVYVDDQNDSPSQPRDVKLLVYTYKGHVLPESRIANVQPSDPDTTGDYKCKLIENETKVPKTPFKIRSGCFLSTTAETQLQDYTLSVMGNDGKHPNVVSTISVSFFKFNERAVENLVLLRIEEMSSSLFLNNYFHTLSDFIKTAMGETAHIFSVKADNQSTELALVVETSNGEYKAASLVIETLMKKYETLVELLQKKVIVGFSRCVQNVCDNGGTCKSRMSIIPNELNTVDGENFIFTSPKIKNEFECACAEGFAGERCDKKLNPCSPNPCQAGGQCRRQGYNFQCYCPSNREGQYCEIERGNACLLNPCKNGGSCRQNADGGSYFCLCRTGYRGSKCEFLVDTCRPSPCLNGGKCIPLKPGYKCACVNGYYGQNCDKSAYSFNELSYMAFSELDATTNDISLVFATTKPNSLLAYNFGTQIGGRSDFISLELIGGKLVFSLGGAQTSITSLVVGKPGESFADGIWHKLTATRNGKVMALSVSKCRDSEEMCDECRVGDPSCYTDDIGPTG